MNNLTSKLIHLLEFSMLPIHQGSFLSTPFILNLPCLTHPLAPGLKDSVLFAVPPSLIQACNHKVIQGSNPTCMTERFCLPKLFNTLDTHISGMKRKELGENWLAGSTGVQLKETQSWNGLISRDLGWVLMSICVYASKSLKLGGITKLYWQWLDKESKKRTKHLISILSNYQYNTHH